MKFSKVTSQEEKNVNSLFVLGFNLGSWCDRGRRSWGGGWGYALPQYFLIH